WRRQAECVRRDQVERRPLPHFTRLQAKSDQIDIIILILPGVVDGRSKIETSKPGPSRPVVEAAGKSASVGQRPGKRHARGHKLTRKTKLVAKRRRLKLKPREIGAIEGKGKSAKIATTKDGGIQNIDPFVINTFHNSASEIKARIEDFGDCASCRITAHRPGEAVLEIENKLRANESRD